MEYSWQKQANRNKNARLGSFSSHNNQTILMKKEYFRVETDPNKGKYFGKKQNLYNFSTA